MNLLGGEDRYGTEGTAPPSGTYSRETDGVDRAEDVVLPRNQAGDEEQSHDSSSQRRDSSPSSFRLQRKHTRAAIPAPAKSGSPCTSAPRTTCLPASSGLLFTGAYHTFSCEQSRGASLVCDGMPTTPPARRGQCRSCPEHGPELRTDGDPSGTRSGTRSAEGGSCVITDQDRGFRLWAAGGNN